MKKLLLGAVAAFAAGVFVEKKFNLTERLKQKAIENIPCWDGPDFPGGGADPESDDDSEASAEEADAQPADENFE